MSGITYDPSVAHEWEIIDGILVTRTNDSIPTALWVPFIDRVKVGDVRQICAFVVGPASISANQRKDAAETFKSGDIPVTVVTDSRITRGVLTALSWLGVNVRGFRWPELDAALATVSAADAHQAQIRAIAERCRRQVM